MAIDRALYDALRARRVTRKMSGRALATETVDLVIRAARFAPNAGNRRLQPVIAVTDHTTLRLLRLVSPGMIPVPQAAIVICIDEGRAASYGFPPGMPGLYIDVGTVAATLLTAAQAVGLGACPVTSFSRAAAARILALSETVKPYMLICLGYPDPVGAPPPMAGPEKPPVRA
jgi:nitroreductase